MGIKFPNLLQTKGCTCQSGRISGESHKEPTTEEEEEEEGEFMELVLASAVVVVLAG